MLVFRSSLSTQSVTYLLLNSLSSEFSALCKAQSSAAQNKEAPEPNASRDEPRYEALDVWEEAMSCLMRHGAKKAKRLDDSGRLEACHFREREKQLLNADKYRWRENQPGRRRRRRRTDGRKEQI